MPEAISDGITARICLMGYNTVKLTLQEHCDSERGAIPDIKLLGQTSLFRRNAPTSDGVLSEASSELLAKRRPSAISSNILP